MSGRRRNCRGSQWGWGVRVNILAGGCIYCLELGSGGLVDYCVVFGMDLWSVCICSWMGSTLFSKEILFILQLTVSGARES